MPWETFLSRAAIFLIDLVLTGFVLAERIDARELYLCLVVGRQFVQTIDE